MTELSISTERLRATLVELEEEVTGPWWKEEVKVHELTEVVIGLELEAVVWSEEEKLRVEEALLLQEPLEFGRGLEKSFVPVRIY